MNTNKAITLSVVAATLMAFDVMTAVSANEYIDYTQQNSGYTEVANQPILSAPHVVIERTAMYDKNCDGHAETGSVEHVFIKSGECAILGVGAQNIGGSPAQKVNLNIPLSGGMQITNVYGDMPETLNPGDIGTLIYHVKMQ